MRLHTRYQGRQVPFVFGYMKVWYYVWIPFICRHASLSIRDCANICYMLDNLLVLTVIFSPCFRYRMQERFDSTRKVRGIFTFDIDSRCDSTGRLSIDHLLNSLCLVLASFLFQDHTIANLFRMQLLRDPTVRFAGYYHPHPLVHYINLKIQTNNSNVAPVEVLSSAIEDLSNETDHLITQFTEAIEQWKRENESSEMAGQF